MKKNIKKPSPEAKALSLFLMAYKTKNPIYKEKSKRINRQWDLLQADQITRETYMQEVQDMLTSYGGYSEVIKKTIQYYIDKTGEWKSKGDDQYSRDAKEIAASMSKK